MLLLINAASAAIVHSHGEAQAFSHSPQSTCVDDMANAPIGVDGQKCGNAWGYDCDETGVSLSCDVVKYCAGSCVTRTSMTCEKLKASEERLCNGGGGSGPGGDVAPPASGCKRMYAPPTQNWAGNEGHMLEGRDGKISQSGDIITVQVPRVTPDWCVDPSVKPPSAGWSGSWRDYYRQVGLSKLACVGWTTSVHDKVTSDYPTCHVKADSNRSDTFSYDALAQSAGYFPDFMGFASFEQSALDLASFVAHSSKETMGSDTLWENAWCWTTELTYNENPYPSESYGLVGNSAAKSPVCAEQDKKLGARVTTPPKEFSKSGAYPSWNAGYWGRGALQLTHCYNYHYFTEWAETTLGIPKTPETDFYANPGFVATKDWAFASGLWFYMSPSSDGMKPSMHSIVNHWKADGSDMTVDQESRSTEFGYQTQIINGGLECGSMANGYAEKRAKSFKHILGYMNYPNPESHPALGVTACNNGQPMHTHPHIYWVQGNLQCSGDNISPCADDDQCPFQPDSIPDVPNTISPGAVVTTKAPEVVTTKAPEVVTTKAPEVVTTKPVVNPPTGDCANGFANGKQWDAMTDEKCQSAYTAHKCTTQTDGSDLVWWPCDTTIGCTYSEVCKATCAANGFDTCNGSGPGPIVTPAATTTTSTTTKVTTTTSTTQKPITTTQKPIVNPPAGDCKDFNDVKCDALVTYNGVCKTGKDWSVSPPAFVSTLCPAACAAFDSSKTCDEWKNLQ